MRLKKFFSSSALAFVFLLSPVALLGSRPAQAAMIGYDVNFSDLGTLSGTSGLKMDFQLIPLGGANSSTTVNFSNFNYGSGGSLTGDLPKSLTDVAGLNETFSEFTAGNSLFFHIDANYDPAEDPADTLSFALFTGAGPDPGNFTETSLTTEETGDTFGDGASYFTIDFKGAKPTVYTYAGTSPAFAAPTVTVSPAVVATPEPQTWAMMAMGLGIVALAFRRRKSEAEANKNSGLVPVRVGN